tara:strand:- start:584 stop:1003 length:420 start_codon:yes stop_codon:yes gene_type:complete
MADPVTITMVAIFATTIINAGVNTKFQNDQICDLDDQIDSLTDKIQTVTNQWATVIVDDQTTFDKVRESTVETLQTCQTLQQKTVSTQQTLRRQKSLLTLVSFIIVLTTGLSLFIKLLLRKQESGIKTNLDLTSYKFKK